MHPKPITMTAVISALLFAAPGVFAQEGAQPPQGYDVPPQNAQPAQVEVDEATIDKFSNALGEIATIQQKFAQQLEEVEPHDAQARALQMEAQQEMIAAVERNGLTVAKYNQVANLVNQDPKLRERVLEEQAKP